MLDSGYSMLDAGYSLLVAGLPGVTEGEAWLLVKKPLFCHICKVAKMTVIPAKAGHEVKHQRYPETLK